MARKIKTRNKNQISKNMIGKVIYYLALLSFVGVIVYVVFFSRLLAITDIEISGTNNVSKQDVLDIVRRDIAGKYGKIIDKDNLLLTITSPIEKQLRGDFKKIETISVRKKFPSTILVNIQERKPMMIFLSAGQYFIIDDKGDAFEEISTDSADFNREEWPIFQDNSNKKTEENEKVMENDLMSFFLTAREKIKNDVDLTLNRVSETPNRMSYDIRMKTTDGWMIYLNANLDVNKEIEMLKTVLDDKIAKDQRPNLEYIDLRSDNKIFYKFKEGTEVTQENNDQENTDNQQPKSDKEKKKDEKKKG